MSRWLRRFDIVDAYMVGKEGDEHLLELTLHAVSIDVAEAGHMVAGDKNDRFNAAVERFLGSLAFPQNG